MKKILLTEAQNQLVENYKAEKTLLESVEHTKAGYGVRNLIKEGETIKGEYQNYFGKWHSTEWDKNGCPLKFQNEFEKGIYTLVLPE